MNPIGVVPFFEKQVLVFFIFTVLTNFFTTGKTVEIIRLFIDFHVFVIIVIVTIINDDTGTFNIIQIDVGAIFHFFEFFRIDHLLHSFVHEIFVVAPEIALLGLDQSVAVDAVAIIINLRIVGGTRRPIDFHNGTAKFKSTNTRVCCYHKDKSKVNDAFSV